MILRDLLRVLGSSDRRDGRNLTNEEAHRAFGTILDGEESDIRVGAFLIAMRWKGVTVEELTGFARAARERATLPCQDVAGLVCVCPPLDGYDQHPPLEVASALVAAGAGVRVLVLTDRGVPPRRGLTAACVLEHLRAGISWDPAEVDDLVGSLGFAAVSASGLLPALLGLRQVRDDMGVRTPLSTVEKLIVPASAAVVLGAQHGPVLGTAVETMAGLGHPSGIAIQGLSGGRHKTPLTVEPADFGLQHATDPELPMFGPPEEGQGSGDNQLLVRAAGDMVDAVLKGETGPARNASLLGAAVVLKAAGRVMTLAEGVDTAVSSLDSGAALDVLEKLRAAR
jgi:anthranilate phosphoribosyltransferase